MRAAIGVTGQFASVDDLLTGEENLLLMADLVHLPKAEGKPAARRAWSSDTDCAICRIRVIVPHSMVHSGALAS